MGHKATGPYRAYVLRCWLEESPLSAKEACWRFSLEQVLKGRSRRGFGSLEAMIAYPRLALDAAAADPPSNSEPSPRAPSG